MPVYGSVPTEEHYHAAIWACQQSNQYLLTVNVYTDLKNKGLTASPDIYALLSSVAESTGHYEQAVVYFNSSRSDDARNDTSRYNVCMRALAQLRRPQEVLSLLEDMKTRGVRRDECSYQHCADAYAELKDGVSALRLLDDMAADHVQPTTPVYNGIL
jgi:pentatricopeptide repeat protein